MTCQELGDLFELYALGVLEPADKSEIDAHLARGCDELPCTRSRKRWHSTRAILSFAPGAAPSRRLKRRVLTSVGVHYPSWGWVWAVGAVCMLVIAAWLGFEERGRTFELAAARRALIDSNSERDRLTQALQFLSDPQTVPASFGKGQNSSAARLCVPASADGCAVDRVESSGGGTGQDLRNVGDPEGRRTEARGAVPIGRHASGLHLEWTGGRVR